MPWFAAPARRNCELRGSRGAATQIRARGRARAAPRADGALGLLGLEARNASELVAVVERGLPFSALEEFKRHTALPWEAILSLVQLPMRTLSRRRAAGRLDSAESDRLIRAARLFHQLLELYEGEVDAARAWLARPQRGLGGATPLEFARTETGAREVERLLGRLAYGVVT